MLQFVGRTHVNDCIGLVINLFSGGWLKVIRPNTESLALMDFNFSSASSNEPSEL